MEKMKNKRIHIKINIGEGKKKRKIIIKDYILCKSVFSKIRGLMFRSRKWKKPLVFVFNKNVNISIHSFFVFFDFYAVWMRKNKIIEVKLVKPCRINIRPKHEFDRLIEIPLDYF